MEVKQETTVTDGDLNDDKMFFESKKAWKEYYLKNKEAVDLISTGDLNRKYKVKDHLFRRMYNVITFKKDIPYIKKSETVNKRLHVLETSVSNIIEIMNEVQEKLDMF